VKRVGPELKLPKLRGGEMKVPPFVSDVYADLRDRRLLPLVALILAAIVATPILLAGGAEEPESAPAPVVVGSAPAAQDLTVVKASPGLRNYKKRLAHRSPTNPFKQRFAAPASLEGAQLNAVPAPTTSAPSETSSSASEGGTSFEPESTGSAPPPSNGGGGASGGNPGGQSEDGLPAGAIFYTLKVTLQITRIETKADGTVEKKGPTLYKQVEAPTPLPGEKTPVVTYLGMGSKNHEPLFLVSTDVTAIFGEAKCISGTGTCQLMALEEGFPVTFVYGDNDVRYKINLVKAEPVVIDENGSGHSRSQRRSP
jgi:hypothetical protein